MSATARCKPCTSDVHRCRVQALTKLHPQSPSGVHVQLRCGTGLGGLVGWLSHQHEFTIQRFGGSVLTVVTRASLAFEMRGLRLCRHSWSVSSRPQWDLEAFLSYRPFSERRQGKTSRHTPPPTASIVWVTLSCPHFNDERPVSTEQHRGVTEDDARFVRSPLRFLATFTIALHIENNGERRSPLGAEHPVVSTADVGSFVRCGGWNNTLIRLAPPEATWQGAPNTKSGLFRPTSMIDWRDAESERARGGMRNPERSVRHLQYLAQECWNSEWLLKDACLRTGEISGPGWDLSLKTM